MQEFLNIVAANRAGGLRGIYSVCTAHPLVLDAAFCQGVKDNSLMLIEATANQVNQFGGYTGMKPEDFPPYIEAIAEQAGFPKQNIVLGGDHLGPVCWVDEPAKSAMDKARALIDAYVVAGFKKIHLDTSMPCADDPAVMTDALVSSRAADLCDVAEKAAIRTFGQSDLLYVVGTEVPTPGGETESIEGLQVTPASAVRETVDAHRNAFIAKGLDEAWSRVIGLVVQPGVEFDHTSIHDFVPEETGELSALIDEIPNLVYEAHSTDYQPTAAYEQLVKQHFAILKVGPQVTFALREALFALSHIEDELIAVSDRGQLRDICEQVMLEEPGHWQKYYPRDGLQARLYRRYSYSDRIRYYWTNPVIKKAVATLMENLSNVEIPLPLLKLYMPIQYEAVRQKRLVPTPNNLVRHHIMQVTECYSAACSSR